MKNIIRIIPETKEYIWGGNKLRDFGISSEGSNIAEAWIFSFNPNGLSKDINGKPINEVILDSDLGDKYRGFPFFPYLIKFIDAKENLSVQVHPSDDYALKNENSFGKTEMWYILDAEKDAYIYLGLNDNYTPEKVKESIENNTICNLLNKVYVKPGECYFVESGTLHAIGAGVVINEIQQNSHLTYRVYDYDRVDKFGNHRELHIEKALKVINYSKFIPQSVINNPLGSCKYFDVNKTENENIISAENNAGKVISFIFGNGKIENEDFKKGDTFFLKAGKTAKIEGKYLAITTSLI